MAMREFPGFEDWEVKNIKGPEFIAAAMELEPGYQVARLRMLRGLSQVQLAEMLAPGSLPSLD